MDFFFPWVPEVLEGPKFAVLVAFVVAAGLVWAIRLVRTQTLKRVPWPLLALFGLVTLVAAFAWMFSANRWTGFIGSPGYLNHPLGLSLTLAAYALLITQLDRIGLRWLLRFVVLGGGLAALYNGARLVGVNLLPIDAAAPATFNLVGSATGSVALVLAVTLMVSIGLVRSEGGAWRVVSAVAGLLAAVSIVLLDHIVGWLATTVGLVTLLIVAHIGASRSNRVVPWLALGLALTLLGWFTPALPLPNRAPADILLDTSTSRALVTATLKSHPMFGRGPEQFPAAFATARPLAYNETAFWNLRFLKARTEFHQLLVTQGAVGLVAMAGLIGFLIVFFALRVRRGAASDSFAVGAAWFGVLATAMIFPFSLPATFLFAVLGAALVNLLLEGQRNRTVKLAPPQTSWGLLGLSAIIVVGVLTLMLGARVAAAEVQYAKARQAISRSADLDRVRALLRAALALNSRETRYHFTYAQAELVAAQLEATKDKPDQAAFQAAVARAADAVQRAVTLGGRQPDTFEQVADVAAFTEQVTNQDLSALADDAYAQAAALEPTYPLHAVRRGQIALQRVDRLNAAREQVPEDQLATFEAELTRALDVADEQFRAAGKLKQSFTLSELGLALVLERRGQPEAALTAMETILARVNGDVDTWFEYARLLRAQKRTDDAIRAYEQVAALRTDTVAPFLALGELYEQAGRTDEARAAYQQVERLAPGTAGIAEKLQALGQ